MCCNHMTDETPILSPEQAKERHLRMVEELQKEVEAKAAVIEKKRAAFFAKSKKDKEEKDK